MSTVKTQPPLFDQLEIFVDEYNSSAKILKIALVLRDFDLWDTGFPDDYVVDLMQQLYEQATIDLIEAQFGLGLVENGDSWPDLITGVSVEIHEDYLLSSVSPGTSGFPAYIPASVIDPKQFEFLKYRTLVLSYTYKDTFSEDWPDRPYGQPFVECPVTLGYPAGLWFSWPYPKLIPGNLVWSGHPFMGIWSSLPTGHWRYIVSPEWILLLTAQPSSPDYWMQEGVTDCFRQAMPSDGGPDWDPRCPKWISRGINDSWVDSYDELKNRGFAPNAYRRPMRWFSLGGWSDYRLRQTSSRDYVEIKIWRHYTGAEVYGPGIQEGAGGPHIFIPGLGLLGQFGLDLSLLGARTEEVNMADIMSLMFPRGGDSQ